MNQKQHQLQQQAPLLVVRLHLALNFTSKKFGSNDRTRCCGQLEKLNLR